MTRAEKAKLLASIIQSPVVPSVVLVQSAEKQPTKTFEIDGKKIAYETKLPADYYNGT